MKATVLMVIPILWLTGCVDESRVAGLEARVTELAKANEKIASLETQVRDLSFKQMLKSWGEVAYLTPGSDGYASIRFDLGVLTIAIDDIQPFANGSKVTLRVGNPLAAKINGLKATIDWGEVDEKGMPKNEAGKSKEVVFTEQLPSGTWTRVNLVLDGVKTEKLGFIRVRDVGHQGIALSKSW
jgi:hypothetical protein